jgi:glycosyltransferase involved in cell wall biosynthesis
MKIHILTTPIFNLLCTNRLACGNEAGNFMHGKHNFTVINNGIDTSRFFFNYQNRQEIRLSFELGDKIVIGHVGTLNDSHKNQSFLIHILKKLVNINENYHLFLLGDGEDRSNLKQKVSRLGLESNTTFAGAVDDVAPFLSAFDLIVMPSFYEGLPLSLIEEQANGLNCIVSDVITEEVNVTGNVTFLSLEKGADYWAETIIASIYPLNREQDSNNAILKIVKSGYGVNKQSRLLMEQYEEVFRKRKQEL